jgi:hypothetical protein
MQVDPIWPNAGNSQDKQIRKVEGNKKKEINSKRTQGEGRRERTKKGTSRRKEKGKKKSTKDNLEIEGGDGIWEILKNTGNMQIGKWKMAKMARMDPKKKRKKKRKYQEEPRRL